MALITFNVLFFLSQKLSGVVKSQAGEKQSDKAMKTSEHNPPGRSAQPRIWGEGLGAGREARGESAARFTEHSGGEGPQRERNQRPLSPLQLPSLEANCLEGGGPGAGSSKPSREQGGGGLLSSPFPLSPLSPMQDANDAVKAGEMGPPFLFLSFIWL